ncbi:GNAT family N-acetyltransferase [Pseudonocardia spinosispora]|uniref:GNAT family N-acetyltransferase n=1 Tax=Pseudonocardia spinosispora TaxID=103441 RepID=UPI000402B366|nr:GNAT family N-acetyltransferase [Pseudonocardia spinosispora]
MFLFTDLTEADRPELSAMVERCSPASRQARFLSCAPQAGPDHVATLFRDPDSHTVVVRGLGTGIIGFGSLFLDGTAPAELALLVEDAYQGQGIGRLLFDALRDHARSAGVTELEMTALTGNTRMIKLFRSARFRPTDSGTVTGVLSVAA